MIPGATFALTTVNPQILQPETVKQMVCYANCGELALIEVVKAYLTTLHLVYTSRISRNAGTAVQPSIETEDGQRKPLYCHY